MIETPISRFAQTDRHFRQRYIEMSSILLNVGPGSASYRRSIVLSAGHSNVRSPQTSIATDGNGPIAVGYPRVRPDDLASKSTGCCARADFNLLLPCDAPVVALRQKHRRNDYQHQHEQRDFLIRS